MGLQAQKGLVNPFYQSAVVGQVDYYCLCPQQMPPKWPAQVGKSTNTVVCISKGVFGKQKYVLKTHDSPTSRSEPSDGFLRAS
jgi:hypothetical protein